MNYLNSLIPLFDIDWTLLDGINETYRNSFKHMFNSVYGLQDADVFDINPHGMTDSQIIIEVLKVHHYLGKREDLKLDLAFSSMCDYYSKYSENEHIQTMPGAKELLGILGERNVTMGILTGNVQHIAKQKLNSAKILKSFSFGAYGDMAIHRSELVNIARNSIQPVYGEMLHNQHFVIIGDSPRDILCARESGSKSIGVSTGSYNARDLESAGADLVVTSLNEIQTIVSFLFKNSKLPLLET